ncbi:MAG: hypothetical protein ABIO57_02275 [Candidatus Paceibacterota bacterium]
METKKILQIWSLIVIVIVITHINNSQHASENAGTIKIVTQPHVETQTMWCESFVEGTIKKITFPRFASPKVRVAKKEHAVHSILKWSSKPFAAVIIGPNVKYIILKPKREALLSLDVNNDGKIDTVMHVDYIKQKVGEKLSYIRTTVHQVPVCR